MIHTNLKKRYTPPQIEVTMSEIEDELLEGSITGFTPGQDSDDDGWGDNSSKADYFGFDNFADYYDNDDEDYYEF